MTEQQKLVLLSKYEKIKGYSSDLFNNEEWAEFDSFCFGYLLAYEDLSKDVEYIKKEYQTLNEMFDKVTKLL